MNEIDNGNDAKHLEEHSNGRSDSRRAALDINVNPGHRRAVDRLVRSKGGVGRRREDTNVGAPGNLARHRAALQAASADFRKVCTGDHQNA